MLKVLKTLREGFNNPSPGNCREGGRGVPPLSVNFLGHGPSVKGRGEYTCTGGVYSVFRDTFLSPKKYKWNKKILDF